jgi:hypothetical protein
MASQPSQPVETNDWRKRLKSMPSGVEALPGWACILFRVFLVLGSLVVLGVGVFCWFAFGSHIETGFHERSVDWLPTTATNISYFKNRNIANIETYEFCISGPDFAALAHDRGWAVKLIEKPMSILRYTWWLAAEHPQRMKPFYAEASKGSYYEDRRPNNGGIAVLYNEDSQTAYVDKSNR